MRSTRTPSAPQPVGPHDREPAHLLNKTPVAGSTPDGRDSRDGREQQQADSSKDSELQLPHERDQSTGADATGGMGTGAAGDRQREVLQQAHQDLKQGQVDTDLRATPGLDAQQRQGMVNDPKGAPAPRGSVAQHDKAGRS